MVGRAAWPLGDLLFLGDSVDKTTCLRENAYTVSNLIAFPAFLVFLKPFQKQNKQIRRHLESGLAWRPIRFATKRAAKQQADRTGAPRSLCRNALFRALSSIEDSY
jgi:hypothetical protein